MLAQYDFPDTIYAIQHLSFADLGAWEDVCYELGFRVRYFEAGVDDLEPAFQHPGIVVILGGSINSHDQMDFPFIAEELDLLGQRLAQKQPTLGIGLGAELITQALNATVTPQMPTIAWQPIHLSSIHPHPLHTLANIPVLHWSRAQLSLPQGATLLATHADQHVMAFSVDTHVLALQFHAEISAEHLEKWLLGHYTELKLAGINISQLREDNQKHAFNLQLAATNTIRTFIQSFIC